MVIVLIIGLGIGFFGGFEYQKGQKSTTAQFAGANGQFRRFGQGGASGTPRQAPVIGSILSTDSNSLTVKLSDGSSKIILLTGGTQISKTDTGSASDLKMGENVLVTGNANSDGSVTASNVMINPTTRLGGRGQQPSPSSQNQGY